MDEKLPINNPKPDLHNIKAHTEFGENQLTFTRVLVRKRKYGWTNDGQTDAQTDGHTDSQRDTIITCHYRVAGNNNTKPTEEKIILFLTTFYSVGNNIQEPKGFGQKLRLI